ncbi:MAG: OB-fold domain-containing protein [Burkholderiaceae bacterium]
MTALVSIAMQKCRRCGTIDSLTRTVCSNCLGDTFDPVDVDGSGTLVSWTTIRRAPTQFRDDVPYDVCIVDLANGQRVTGRLVSGDGIAVGAAVAATALRGDTPIFSPLR